ncbi:hypothetical protein OUZ56_024407 [Daphnia magna]|uniref:Uncharacterized protein n=1 Tax=Daphnia magna TaxID=35525 RepID=A0ABR0B1E4_9CRUS|nr:hypothetical protein OUZ56_024407 [Daphnia magna]
MTPLPIMGVSLPMEVNGLRNHKRAVVTDIKSIIDVFEEFRRATLMLVVMALPLVDRLPPIRILSFCTDNKFTAEDVKARMHFIISAFAAEGILALVCSADADAHEMKFMRETEELGIPGGQEMLYSLKPTYFYFAAIRIGCGIPVQFPVHQANVNYIASPVHLQTLMNQHDKSRHLLKPEDLNVHCKMNYGSAERLGQLHVPQLLEYVEALSYVDQNLSPLERVYRMWYVVFSLRLWRYWITCDTAYTLAANFMTLNVYLCVEFNAHALTIQKLSNHGCVPASHVKAPSEVAALALRTAQQWLTSPLATSRLTAYGVKDGLSYPRFERPFDQPRNQCSWKMPSMEEMDYKIRVALDVADKDF